MKVVNIFAKENHCENHVCMPVKEYVFLLYCRNSGKARAHQQVMRK